MMNNSTKINDVQSKAMNNTNYNKEDDIMTDINKNLGVTPLADVSSLIPKEEQAVTEIRPVFYEIKDMFRDLISEIPEDEQEVVLESDTAALTLAREQGCFVPVQNMKGFESDFGHRFYAGIYVDSKGTRFIEYRQQYSNGNFSEKMRVAQADLMIAASCKFKSKDIREAKLRNKVATFILDVSRDYYNKLEFPEENLDILNLLDLFLKNYSKLPQINRRYKLDNPEFFYDVVIQNIKKLGNALVDDHKAYYALSQDQISTVAEKMGMKKDELLKKLKEHNFLYLTPSSDGYQTCVRFKAETSLEKEFLEKSHTEWCYCVLKMEYLAMQRKMRAQG